MLKLVSLPRSAGRQTAQPKKIRNRLGAVNQRVEQYAETGNSVQRVIARGRRHVIDLHGRVRREASTTHCSEPRRRPAVDSVRRTELARRLTEIHRRLLFFSVSVELEMDRLEMVRAELAQLGGDRNRKR